jgi:diadenosine tetraphosphatase ApaH/serine/threonine PP2A family protein phosphatase
MKIAIIGDIHSNLEALRAVLNDIRKNSINEIISIGDVVGYGANPKDCIKIVKENINYICAGNHDWAVAGNFELSWFNENAKEAILWTKEMLNMNELYWLKDLPLIQDYKDFVLVHSNLYEPEKFHYLLDLKLAQRSFDYQEKKICFIGHSHVPFFVWLKELSGELDYSQNGVFKIEHGKRYIVNVGSVGQPRDGDTRACYAIYDEKEDTISIRRVDYDIDTAQEKIVKVGLPIILAERLAEGK